MEIEEMLRLCSQEKCNVEYIGYLEPTGLMPVYAVRLRPFANKAQKDNMVLGKGETFADALQDAVKRAEQGRWEPLDWAKRPWETRPVTLGGWAR
jgi:hypothetical protein